LRVRRTVRRIRPSSINYSSLLIHSAYSHISKKSIRSNGRFNRTRFYRLIMFALLDKNVIVPIPLRHAIFWENKASRRVHTHPVAYFVENVCRRLVKFNSTVLISNKDDGLVYGSGGGSVVSRHFTYRSFVYVNKLCTFSALCYVDEFLKNDNIVTHEKLFGIISRKQFGKIFNSFVIN